MEICGDNRFEIIAKAKAHLLEATNIDTSEDEMKVIDDFLFRCWQMGWLDRYAEQTEPQTDIEIARAIVHKAIDDAAIAEDAYPEDGLCVEERRVTWKRGSADTVRITRKMIRTGCA